MNKLNISILLLTLLSFGRLSANVNVGVPVKQHSGSSRHNKGAGCEAASQQVDLDINNVRARIENGGDMWWDLQNTAKYEVPKVTEAGQVSRTSLFAGALWIGGYENGNLREAAQTYRQNGNDFFPGPLDTTTATITSGECKNWDKIWKINRDEIDRFVADRTSITDAIRTWPAQSVAGDPAGFSHSRYLAPFVDVDGDMQYKPQNGDYPKVFGDQTLWFVFNDKGNIHSETGSDPIGLECQTQAFAFTTNDEINDMTFYSTTVINRSKNQLDTCYFGQWVDPDLGYFNDDYVGCDIGRSLGICYNGEDFDPGVFGYGQNPPSVGVDFFKGPIDPKTGTEIGMSYFVYYNNDFSNWGNPERADHYYGYLTGHWKNGQPITFGGDGHSGAQNAHYMFPDDPRKPLPAWSERSANNKPSDRRFLQSSGPFSLKPGAKNEVTVGVVWARATSGGAVGSLDKLKLADDKAQLLYNNNFRLPDGPKSPDLVIHESDQKLVISLENTHQPSIEQFNDTIRDLKGNPVHYTFEGYRIFQLKNSSVSASQLNNPELAQEIAQCDVKNKYSVLINKIQDPTINDEIKVLQVSGANAGIRHTFEITGDAFATGDKKLVNYKFYYFMVVAYAVANDNPDAPQQYLAGGKSLTGQIKVFTGVPHKNTAEMGGTILHSAYGDGPEITRILGSGNGDNVIDLNYTSYDSALNHNAVTYPTYMVGKAPVAVKVYDPARVVKGHYTLQFVVKASDTAKTKYNKSTLNDILYAGRVRWLLRNTDTHEQVMSDTTINYPNEQLAGTTEIINGETKLKPWGLAISVNQAYNPGPGPKSAGYPNANSPLNSFLEATLTYGNANQHWLSGVPDISAFNNLQPHVPTPQNWIRAGTYVQDKTAANLYKNTDDLGEDSGTDKIGHVFYDPNGIYAKMFTGSLQGTIAPAALAARSNTVQVGTTYYLTMGPIPGDIDDGWTSTYLDLKMDSIPNINLVFTPDKSKWSRSVVLEASEGGGLSEGGVKKFALRAHNGWMGDVDASGNPVYSTDPKNMGRSVFPGYAINAETGQRMNIIFMEDSHLPAENGADMLWNPTDNMANSAAGAFDFAGRYLWGGKHWIWIMASKLSTSGAATPYDGCDNIYNKLTSGNAADKRDVYKAIQWVMEPAMEPTVKLNSLKDGLIPTETTLRIRLAKTYTVSGKGTGQQLPFFKFNTDNIAPEFSNTEAGKTALDRVRVTPNPYYCYSSYENSQLDNKVRINNLPPKVEISIYTLDWSLVRRFTKDELNSTSVYSDDKAPTTYLDWDLKNQKGVPVSSGVYLIHINGYDLGEKVIKWFGVMKPIDLDTF